MGVNLTLIPLMGGELELMESDVLAPYERISFSERLSNHQKFQSAIRKLRPKPLPQGTKVVLRERGDKRLENDPYGERIMYLPAYRLAWLQLDKRFKSADWTEWDLAVIAFSQRLPSSTPVLLFWH